MRVVSLTKLLGRCGARARRCRVVAVGLTGVALTGVALTAVGSAAASVRHPATRVIYTHRVVGFDGAADALRASHRGGPPVGRTRAPRITLDPVNTSVAAGASVSFSAAASGSPEPTVQWELSTDGGIAFTPIPGATTATYGFTAATGENGDEYEAVFTNSAGSATSSPATLTVTSAPAPPPTPTLTSSSNWSGYVDTAAGQAFDTVSASWTVPAVSCQSRGDAYAAQWVGIDGDTSATVEQDGTETDCLGGVPSYDAWYEMYGDNALDGGDEVELSPSSYPVSPGDRITATVSVTGSTWMLSLADTSTTGPGWSVTTPVTFAGAAQSSAEWIVERPELCGRRSCSLTSLADFGTVDFTGAATGTGATSGSISTFSDSALEMVDRANVIALPSALSADGSEFTDTWQAA